jgi:hypothetical protein
VQVILIGLPDAPRSNLAVDLLIGGFA